MTSWGFISPFIDELVGIIADYRHRWAVKLGRISADEESVTSIQFNHGTVDKTNTSQNIEIFELDTICDADKQESQQPNALNYTMRSTLTVVASVAGKGDKDIDMDITDSPIECRPPFQYINATKPESTTTLNANDTDDTEEYKGAIAV